jgi:hypothetical protein
MRDQRTNPGVPGDMPARKTCSRCGEEKPISAFYDNPANVCKHCQNRASRFSNACRQAALAHLIQAHQAEYKALLAAERSQRLNGPESSLGGGPYAA